MEYSEYMSKKRTTNNRLYEDYFKRTFTLPKDFDEKDPKKIKVFGERLSAVLEATKSRNKEISTKTHTTQDGRTCDLAIEGPKYCDVTTAKKLAERLGLTAANISRYIHGKNQSVPTQYFLHLYDIFGVTPHYLAGYTDNMYGTLLLDSNREIVCNDGIPVEICDPMTPIFSVQDYVRSQFTNLLFESPEHFSTLTDLMYADEIVRNGAFAILRVYLDAQKNNATIRTKAIPKKGSKMETPK